MSGSLGIGPHEINEFDFEGVFRTIAVLPSHSIARSRSFVRHTIYSKPSRKTPSCKRIAYVRRRPRKGEVGILDNLPYSAIVFQCFVERNASAHLLCSQ